MKIPANIAIYTGYIRGSGRIIVHKPWDTPAGKAADEFINLRTLARLDRTHPELIGAISLNLSQRIRQDRISLADLYKFNNTTLVQAIAKTDLKQMTEIISREPNIDYLIDDLLAAMKRADKVASPLGWIFNELAGKARSRLMVALISRNINTLALHRYGLDENSKNPAAETIARLMAESSLLTDWFLQWMPIGDVVLADTLTTKLLNIIVERELTSMRTMYSYNPYLVAKAIESCRRDLRPVVDLFSLAEREYFPYSIRAKGRKKVSEKVGVRVIDRWAEYEEIRGVTHLGYNLPWFLQVKDQLPIGTWSHLVDLVRTKKTDLGDILKNPDKEYLITIELLIGQNPLPDK